MKHPDRRPGGNTLSMHQRCNRVLLLLLATFVVSLALTSRSDAGESEGKTHRKLTQVESDSKSATGNSSASPATSVRWYKSDSVDRGKSIYAENCAACHGERGEGSFTWRKRGEDGKFPPPPLNGTGHTWHHPFRILGMQIKSGAPGGQGSMPRFGDRLSDQQIVDVIAWFQDLWTDEIYDQWWQIELRSRQ